MDGSMNGWMDGFGDCSSPDDSSPDCSSHGLFVPLSYKMLGINNLASIIFKESSFYLRNVWICESNLSSFYLAKNYFINRASNKQLNNIFCTILDQQSMGRIVRGRIVRTPDGWKDGRTD